MLTLLTGLALAQVPTCEKVGLADVADIQAPAVIVMGERRGVWPDLIRAQRLVNRLRRDHTVTLAVQPVLQDRQPVLDQLARGEIGLVDVPALSSWRETWGIPWSGYQGLFSTIQVGVSPIAIGVPTEIRPEDQAVQTPPGYLHVLLDAVGEHAVPVELEPTLIQTMAWKDHRMAANAIEQWDGEGVLAILVDRLHVEGGMGVPWQAQRLTQAPVHSVLLANGKSPCYPGDRVWRDHPFDR